MSTSEAIVALRDVEKSLRLLDRYQTAAKRANAIGTNIVIKSTDDDEVATADRGIIKDGIKALDEAVKSRAWIADPALAGAFKALEAAEARVKAEAKMLKGLLEGRVNLIDEAKKSWVRAETERRRVEAEQQRLAEEAAAKAAAEAAALAEPDEEAPPPVQVAVAPPEPVQRHSVVGTAKATVKTSPVKCEVWLDPEKQPAQARADAILEIARHWPHLLTLNEVAAKAEFAALVARGQAEKPSEAGTVMGGIRFYVTLVVSG